MRQDLNTKQCLHILSGNYIGNLSYIYQDKPFIAPITYFFDAENNVIMGYSAQGHKINAMRRNRQVSISVSEIDSVDEWKSILVHGTFEEIPTTLAKAKLHIFSLGVKDLIINTEHRELNFINDFSIKIEKDVMPIVFQIKVEEITGKMRKPEFSS
ncbi:flavin mononucleotide-binding protein [Bizionia argentinensis JUB59]|uniref:Flavin mononucleotide-binding protein n=1 Tax=Bizionia argentinensis JUB59 TaxID=1046627 RepID=G2ECD6_9FLAO|nr:pyridoxamine 5'-phosphate oxidase family protein [Bizionia argentinensis]EGV43899.1 flavin mononucleotide-binding protein [Bizionia argentinensis JUB59]